MKTKVYYAVDLAKATTGYDPKAQQTLIRCWRLAATGPFELTQHGVEETLQAEVEEILRISAEAALWEAYAAAMATPGEVAARLAMAWQVFWNRFPALVQQNAKAAANRLIDAFSIGLQEVVVREDGLVLLLNSSNPTSQLYDKVYDWVGSQVGGDARKAVQLYAEINRQVSRAFTLDIEVRLPQEVSDFVAGAARVVEDVSQLPQRLADLSTQIQKDLADIERGISTAVVQAGNLPRTVFEQLKMADVKFDLETEDASKRLDALVAGVPKLDWKTVDELGNPVALGKRLNDFGRDLLVRQAEALAAEAQRAQLELERLYTQLEEAVQRGATELVNNLSEYARELETEVNKVRATIGELNNSLQVNNLQVLPVNVSQTVQAAQQAVADVMNHVATAHQRAVKQAADIAKGLLDAAGNAVEEIKDRVRKTFGF